MVAQAVFHRIGIVGVRRPVTGAQVVVVGRMLVLVIDHKTYRRTRRAPLENTGKNLYPVALLAGRNYRRLTRTTAVEFLLYVCGIYLYTGRHTVDYAPHSFSVGFAERGKPEYVSKTVHAAIAINASPTKIIILCKCRLPPPCNFGTLYPGVRKISFSNLYDFLCRRRHFFNGLSLYLYLTGFGSAQSKV